MEEERREFVMETNKYCFICLKNLTRDEEGRIGSFQNVCAHLRINIPQVFKQTISSSLKLLNLLDDTQKWDLKGRFCSACALITEEFEGLLVQLQNIQNKLDQCLSKVQENFIHGNSSVARFSEDMVKNPSSLVHLAFVDTLRKKATERCSVLLDKKSMVQGNQQLMLKEDVKPEIIEMQQELAPPPEVVDVEENDQVPPFPSPPQEPSTSTQTVKDLQKAKMMIEVFNPDFEADRTEESDEECQIVEVGLDGSTGNTTTVGQIPSNHGNARFQCQSCPRTFNSHKEMKIHWRRHHAGMEFKCKMCPKAFPTSHGILCHTRMVHIKPEVQNSKRRSDVTSCDICQKTFTRRYLRQHMKVHSGVKYQCSLCSKIFARQSGFYTHRREVHYFGKSNGNAEAKFITIHQSDSVFNPLMGMGTNVQGNSDPVVHEEEELSSFIIPMDQHEEGNSGANTETTTTQGKGESEKKTFPRRFFLKLHLKQDLNKP